eukprot:scaffold30038_cov45-Isochrysis_galbana.AAC.1
MRERLPRVDLFPPLAYRRDETLAVVAPRGALVNHLPGDRVLLAVARFRRAARPTGRYFGGNRATGSRPGRARTGCVRKRAAGCVRKRAAGCVRKRAAGC